MARPILLLLALCGCPDGGGAASPDLARPAGYECLAFSDCTGDHACCANVSAPSPMPARCSTTTAAMAQCPNGPNLCRSDGDCFAAQPRCCFGVVPGVPANVGTCLGSNCN